jgi:hypothetical protein
MLVPVTLSILVALWEAFSVVVVENLVLNDPWSTLKEALPIARSNPFVLIISVRFLEILGGKYWYCARLAGPERAKD